MDQNTLIYCALSVVGTIVVLWRFGLLKLDKTILQTPTQGQSYETSVSIPHKITITPQ